MLELGILILLFRLSSTCSLNGTKMNCSGYNLTDCPKLDSSIEYLYLDHNELTDLAKGNCSKWNNLNVLNVNNNKLTELKNTMILNTVFRLNASNNMIHTLVLSSKVLHVLDLSYNPVSRIDISNNKMLSELYLNNNNLTDNLAGLTFDYLTSNVKILDLSHNSIVSFSTDRMPFHSNSLTRLNLSFNEIKIFRSVYLPKNPRLKLLLDLSHNKITQIYFYSEYLIQFLDLSFNKIEYINESTLMMFTKLDKMDLSNNPLNCSCETNAFFINWIQKYKDKISNHQSTYCNTKNRLNIFNITCSSSTTQSPSSLSSSLSSLVPSTSNPTSTYTSTAIPTSTYTSTVIPTSTYTSTAISTGSSVTFHTTTTNSTKVDSNHTSLYYFLVTTVPILVIIILISTLCCWRRQRLFVRRNDSEVPTTNCDCWLTLLPLQRLNFSSNTDIADDREAFLNNDELFVEYDLTVFCSKKQRNWVINNLEPSLGLKLKIVSTKLKSHPFTECNLIVIVDMACLKDAVIDSNLKLLESSILTFDSSFDIKILLAFNPDVKEVQKLNSRLGNLVVSKLVEESCIFYDNENGINSFEEIRGWAGSEC